MKLPSLKLLGALGSLLLPMGASAALAYVEVPDAGETLGTAQAVPSGVTIITGNVAAGSADLFKFHWSGGAFYANTVGSTFDSQLFLFDSTGVGVLANDDGIAFAGPAYLQLAALPAGDYYLGVSGYDYDPRDAGNGLMFTSSPFEPLYTPIDGDALDHWSDNPLGSGGGDYAINFQQINSDGTPTPDGGATLGMLSLGLAGLVAFKKRFNK